MDENMTPVEWVNAQLRRMRTAEAGGAGGAGGKLDTERDDDGGGVGGGMRGREAGLQSLLMRVQLMANDLNASLDQTTQAILPTIPSALTQVRGIGVEASALQQQVSELLHTVTLVDTPSSATNALNQLKKLHQIKSRMDACAKTLAEADRLAKGLADLEGGLERNELRAVAHQLGVMQHNMGLVAKLPEFAASQQRLDAVADRLEEMSRQTLSQALQEQDGDKARECVGIYSDMGRMEAVTHAYVNVRKISLTKMWSKHMASKTELDLTLRIPLLYAQLVEAVEKELAWAGSVFQNPSEMVTSLLIEFLNGTGQMLIDTITGATSADAAHRIASTDLLQISSTALDFVHSCLDQLPLISLDARLDVAIAALAPYRALQSVFCDIERRELMAFLDAQFNDLNKSSGLFLDSVELVIDIFPQLFLRLKAAAERCLAFSSGANIVGTVRMCDEVLESCLQRMSVPLSNLRRVARLPAAVVVGSSPALSRRKPDALDGPSGAASSSAGGGSSLGRTSVAEGAFANDWSFFQGALRLLEMCDGVKHRIDELVLFFSSAASERLPLLLSPPSSSHALPRIVSVWVWRDLDIAKQLQAWLVSSHSPSFAPLAKTTTILTSFNISIQDFVRDSALSYIRQQLASLPELRTWAESKVDNGALQFSLSPQPYVTQIGEHLVMLPEQLESFSGTSDEHSSAPIHAPTHATDALSKPQAAVPRVHTPPFAPYWIDQLCAAAIAEFFAAVGEIPFLSQQGLRQLAADVEYLGNVMAVLGLPAAKLIAFRSLAEASGDDFAKCAAEQSTVLDASAIAGLARARRLQPSAIATTSLSTSQSSSSSTTPAANNAPTS